MRSLKSSIFFPLAALIVAATLHGSLISNAMAENLASLRDGDFDLTLNTLPGSPDSYQLSVSSQSGSVASASPSVFTLENPPRLVIDIPDAIGKSAQKREVRSTSIQSLRTGVHSDKMRVVLDLSDAREVAHTSQMSSDGRTVNIQFSFGGSAPTASLLDQTPPPAPEPIANELPGSDSEFTDVVEFDDGGKVEPESSAQMAAKQAPASNSKLPLPNSAVKSGSPEPEPGSTLAVVNGIYYKTLLGNATSAIMVDTKGLANYSITRKDPTMWELTLEQAKLGGAHLSLPQFPPDSFEGFEVVVARQRGNDVIVKIYVEDERKLSPFRARGKLWVKIEQ